MLTGCLLTTPQDENGQLPAVGGRLIQRASGRIFTGGEPKSQSAFERLRQLGVRTVVSVDGARPNIEAARALGIRTIHIPIGYDAIERDAALALTRVVRENEGLIYIHCHHGRHRGPAAAAIACIADEQATPDEALDILETAQTSRDYVGLWRDVAAFTPPSMEEPLPELFEVAAVSSLAERMAAIDRDFDRLKLCRQNQWQTPESHPDLIPVHSALLIKEGLRESTRASEDQPGSPLATWLEQATVEAQALEVALREPTTPAEVLEARFQKVQSSCRACHKRFRN